MELTSRSTLAEVEAELTARKVHLQAAVGGPSYAVDRHFEQYVLDEIVSVEDALALADRLDAEDKASLSWSTGCAKAHGIREWLNKPFWTETPERIRCAVSNHRRTCCSAHETGSFALRQQRKQK